ncbi:hypothetical protein Cme02nite_69260 [Catellatospora methionotrophica]|uniref:Uncharacterized protein n=1 Tax=Catellatospora methionotrophica TaxID=121620 RepID=A0A8J3LN44_9ACTN|nr:hypothetical protein Cme02nite_69260 [Catellatospora methionotrophica]
MLLESPRHHRARKAIAVRNGDHDTAAQADLALRAHRIAKAIKAGCDGPPLPPAVIEQLRNLLPPVRR